ncbi:MAG: branched-chain amino acid ABC transporter permease [Thermaerobacter sp.]|nr:branched-chain amino acid ABC transporter permease [Thermaerobacter sp.]
MNLVFGSVVLGILSGGIYALMAVGLTLSFGVLEVINIAQGMLVVVGAYLSFALESYWHIDPLLGLLITIPTLFLLGFGIEWAFLRPLKQDRVALSILVTYAVALILEGLMGLWFGDNFVAIHAWYVDAAINVFGLYIADIYLIGFALAIVLLGAVYLLLYRSKFGAALRATVQNREAAVLIGIDVQRISTLTFAIATGLTAAGGMLFGATTAFNANSMLDLISRLLMIIILGGMGSMGGALVASLIMLVSVDVVSVAYTPTWSTFVFFALTVVVMVVRPQGLFGAPPARKV